MQLCRHEAHETVVLQVSCAAEGSDCGGWDDLCQYSSPIFLNISLILIFLVIP